MVYKDNIFAVLGVQLREDSISNALAYAFNELDYFRKLFLKTICNEDIAKYNDCKAYTRKNTGKTGTPDIIIICETNDFAKIIIIENKLGASENKEQIEKYASEECIKYLHNDFCQQKVKIEKSIVCLTLFPVSNLFELDLGSKGVLIKSHEELITCDINGKTNNLAALLIKDWINLLRNFYLKGQINEKDKPIEKLKGEDTDILNGSFLYFREFLSKITLPEELRLEYFFRTSKSGRYFYGAIFSKDKWHPSKMKNHNGKWSLEAEKAFNIHFEPQFNALNNVFTIYLHYEVNPYSTVAWVKKNIPEDQYAAYQVRRNNFVEKLKNTNMEGWRFGGRSNQVAKYSFKIDFNKMTFKEAKERIESIFLDASEKIDDSLNKM